MNQMPHKGTKKEVRENSHENRAPHMKGEATEQPVGKSKKLDEKVLPSVKNPPYTEQQLEDYQIREPKKE